MSTLEGKSVLVIAPNFFGYDKAIERDLEIKGATVIRLVDRPFKSATLKALTVMLPSVMTLILDFYYLAIIRQMNNNFDYVLVVNGQTISAKVLRKIREHNQAAHFILYMWDSIKNRQIKNSIHELYDRKFSFDMDAVDLHGFVFRPLFYCGSVMPMKDDCTSRISASFIGTVHSDRYEVLNKIRAQFDDSKCFWYMFLQARWVYWWLKFSKSEFGSSSINEFRFTPLRKSKVDEIFLKSEIIIDIEHPDQTGLTIRTFDAMVSNKKLITTNESVYEYDFYESGNICVIDRQNPIIPQSFIDKRFVPYSMSILEKYSVSGWIDELFLSDKSSSQ